MGLSVSAEGGRFLFTEAATVRKTVSRIWYCPGAFAAEGNPGSH